MGLFKKKKKSEAGHLRVFTTPDGRLSGVEVVSPLLPEEVAPALETALTELSRRSETARRGRVEAHVKACRKKAGILDKLSGKAKERLARAEEKMPAEMFDGRAGAVGITLDGGLGHVSVTVDDGCAAVEAIGLLKRATAAAEDKALEAWEREVLGAAEEEEPAP